MTPPRSFWFSKQILPTSYTYRWCIYAVHKSIKAWNVATWDVLCTQVRTNIDLCHSDSCTSESEGAIYNPTRVTFPPPESFLLCSPWSYTRNQNLPTDPRKSPWNIPHLIGRGVFVYKTSPLYSPSRKHKKLDARISEYWFNQKPLNRMLFTLGNKMGILLDLACFRAIHESGLLTSIKSLNSIHFTPSGYRWFLLKILSMKFS